MDLVLAAKLPIPSPLYSVAEGAGLLLLRVRFTFKIYTNMVQIFWGDFSIDLSAIYSG